MRNIVLSVVVPCYNESKSIPRIVAQFAKSSPEARGFELVLVDNGSTDGSAKSIRALASKYRFVKIATVKKNIGYGHGIFTGLKRSQGEFVCWTHADLQADPLDAARAYEIAAKQLEPRFCYVKGARKNRLLADAFFAFGMSVFAALVLGKWLPDINAQPNLFHKSFLHKLGKPPADFSFDLYAFFIAKKEGMGIIRFPVDFSKRKHGQSHWNTGLLEKWKFIKRTVLFTIGLRHRLEVV